MTDKLLGFIGTGIRIYSTFLAQVFLIKSLDTMPLWGPCEHLQRLHRLPSPYLEAWLENNCSRYAIQIQGKTSLTWIQVISQSTAAYGIPDFKGCMTFTGSYPLYFGCCRCYLCSCTLLTFL